MNYLLETDRLRLREFDLIDSDFIIDLVNSEGWLKYIGDRHIHTIPQAMNYLQNGPLKSYQLNGYGLSLVERKADGRAIGMCGILKREGLDVPDLGFAFLPEVAGQGYALEIVKATLEYVREKYSLTQIAAIVLPDNIRSISLLEKSGFRLANRIRFVDDAPELLLYWND
ncbi:MAG: hypothetical protein DI538_21115 [Azospira oryzae]|nr:MAG: hypothetical protein DI538_21115 [Azospira oryzae]